ncbi:MAG: hypothetical protein Q4F55_02140 [Bacillota bacterium]|nr:hypothetical protein [Bacillota bacterium]
MTKLSAQGIKRLTRGGIVAILLLACVTMLFFVGLDAYSSKIQYDINQINKEIATTEKEIANLEVKIKSATNISTIERKALDLGMIYPSFDQIIYIQGDSNIEEFGVALMESVY